MMGKTELVVAVASIALLAGFLLGTLTEHFRFTAAARQERPGKGFVEPDCQLRFMFVHPGRSIVFDNRTLGCAQWRLLAWPEDGEVSARVTAQVLHTGADDLPFGPVSILTAFVAPAAGGMEVNIERPFFGPWLRVEVTAMEKRNPGAKIRGLLEGWKPRPQRDGK